MELDNISREDIYANKNYRNYIYTIYIYICFTKNKDYLDYKIFNRYINISRDKCCDAYNNNF